MQEPTHFAQIPSKTTEVRPFIYLFIYFNYVKFTQKITPINHVRRAAIGSTDCLVFSTHRALQ